MADFIFTEDDLENHQDESLGDEPNQVRSFIASDMVMEGSLNLKHGIEIGGFYKGAISSNSMVRVVDSGRLEGNVDSFNVSIDGSANLSLVARKRLEINKGGFFIGNLEVQPEIIVLSEFAVFGQDEDTARSFYNKFKFEQGDKTDSSSGNKHKS